ncbi:hypothetical protein [Nocardia sp. alder85J]|uniref:hypothetical protein n=1 Tax=Nocardia sp. alder85J TaxID=2862949 RepID=UPI001CD29261|nr:hypothetical protein [Nocardia sp. alder85J]MCX4093147.1 hypothetical protein [Nocardia sp. alder85J]
MMDDQSSGSAGSSEIAALRQRVATARGKLPLQTDPALLEAMSDTEIAAERELAEWIRAQRRRQRKRSISAELAAEQRDRRVADSIQRSDEADAHWHRRALAARRRVSSPDARLAQLYRRAEWSSRALIAVVVLGMVWAGVNVQHNLVPSGDMTDPLYWLSYGFEAMISIPIITIMVVATTAARWGRDLPRGKIAILEIGLLGITIGLNAGPHIAAGRTAHAAEAAIAPIMVGVIIWLHAWVSARYAMLIDGAPVVDAHTGPSAPRTVTIPVPAALFPRQDAPHTLSTGTTDGPLPHPADDEPYEVPSHQAATAHVPAEHLRPAPENGGTTTALTDPIPMSPLPRPVADPIRPSARNARNGREPGLGYVGRNGYEFTANPGGRLGDGGHNGSNGHDPRNGHNGSDPDGRRNPNGHAGPADRTSNNGANGHNGNAIRNGNAGHSSQHGQDGRSHNGHNGIGYGRNGYDSGSRNGHSGTNGHAVQGDHTSRDDETTRNSRGGKTGADSGNSRNGNHVPGTDDPGGDDSRHLNGHALNDRGNTRDIDHPDGASVHNGHSLQDDRDTVRSEGHGRSEGRNGYGSHDVHQHDGDDRSDRVGSDHDRHDAAETRNLHEDNDTHGLNAAGHDHLGRTSDRNGDDARDGSNGVQYVRNGRSAGNPAGDHPGADGRGGDERSAHGGQETGRVTGADSPTARQATAPRKTNGHNHPRAALDADRAGEAGMSDPAIADPAMAAVANNAGAELVTAAATARPTATTRSNEQQAPATGIDTPPPAATRPASRTNAQSAPAALAGPEVQPTSDPQASTSAALPGLEIHPTADSHSVPQAHTQPAPAGPEARSTATARSTSRTKQPEPAALPGLEMPASEARPARKKAEAQPAPRPESSSRRSQNNRSEANAETSAGSGASESTGSRRRLAEADRWVQPLPIPADTLYSDSDDFDTDIADREIWAVAREISERGMSRLPIDQLAEMLTLADQSWTPAAIGAETGMSGSSVLRILEAARRLRATAYS